MSSQWGRSLRGGEPQQTTENSFDAVDDSRSEFDERDTTLSKTQVFDVLRNSRRRTAVACLRDNGGTMSVTDLSTCVAAEEYDVAEEEVSAEQYKRVYTGLYQCHLERADELGVVDFDADDNVVHLSAEASQLDPYLGDGTPGSAHIELGTALMVGVIVLMAGVGVWPFGLLAADVLAVFTVGVLLALSLLQLR